MKTSHRLTSICIIILFSFGCLEPSGIEQDYGPMKVNAIITKDAGLGLTAVTVEVKLNGVEDDTATVLVNGVTMPNQGAGIYQPILGPGIAVGDDVTLSVSIGGYSMTETLVMPPKPVVTGPTTAGSPYDSTQPITVAWNVVSPTPSQMTISVDDAFTAASGSTWSETLGGFASTSIILANTLSPATLNIKAFILAAKASSYLGSHTTADSWVLVGHYSQTQLFSTQ